MRKLYPAKEGVYQVPNWIPIVFVILASIIIIALTIFKPVYTVPGLVITLLGLPVYSCWKKKKA
jgi:APA family basic amino acid/polyamine antiporter